MAFEGVARESYAPTTHKFSKLTLENFMQDTIVTRAIMHMCIVWFRTQLHFNIPTANSILIIPIQTFEIISTSNK
jgi:hypothetical protein